MTQAQRLVELLKEKWMSSFRMQQELKSSSADRLMRFIRKNPPENYEIISRKVKIEGYPTFLEYKLEKVLT